MRKDSLVQFFNIDQMTFCSFFRIPNLYHLKSYYNNCIVLIEI